MADGTRQGLRVLCVGALYPPHNGGYELLWQAAVEHLRARGHRVEVLTSDLLPPGAQAPAEPGVRRELRAYWRDHEWPETTPRERLALECHNGRVFDRSVSDLRPDVVAWWSMGAISQGLIARACRRRLPAVGFVIDDWMAYAQRTDQWVRAWRRRPRLANAAEWVTRLPTQLDYGAAGRWTFCSEVTRAKAIDEAGPLPDTNVLLPGVDPIFSAHEVPPQAWRWRLLYAGRLDGRKGIHTAIEALAHLPAEATLGIVGGGDELYAERLRRRTAELGVADRVSFEPARDRARLARRYAEADATVFPVEWLEPFGLVPLEAMAVGRPVVATGRGGSGEYLRDGENSLLFAPGDARALAHALERLAGDAALRQALRAGGRRTASDLSEAAWLEGVEDELRSAAQRGHQWPST